MAEAENNNLNMTDVEKAIVDSKDSKNPQLAVQSTGSEGSELRRPKMATIQDDDERLLARMGIRQELRREFTKWSTISYAISILGVAGSIPATITVPLTEGGPATAVWAWAIGSFGSYGIASSVAELVSAYPTAGGMYFVTKYVVPQEHVAIWAWIIGWSNFLGQSAGVASLSYSVALMIVATVVGNQDLETTVPWTPSTWVLVLLSICILCLIGAICSLSTKTLHRTILWFAPINIFASVAICVALLVLTPNRQSAKWVFTEVTDGSGWGSRGFSFLLGFLSVAWTMTDYDGTTHMSEETHDAAIRGPIAIRTAIVVSGIVGWFWTVAICFGLSDFDAIMSSPTGIPAAQVFFNAGGKVGGTIMWFFVILVQFMTGCAAMLSNARMAYAFSRDEALPFSRFWSQINPITKTPVNAVWLVVGFCTCLNLIALGSTETINSIFNLTAPCLDLSYAAVIFARRIYAHRVPFIDGPFTLGKWGAYINWAAILYVSTISVILYFPPSRPITVSNMNYAIVITIGVGVFGLLWWFISARHKYTGPRVKEILLEVPTEDPDYVDSDSSPRSP